MSERMNAHRDVTVIFRQGDSLIVPPFALPREARQEDETYEGALYRLCRDHGVVGYVDYALLAGDLAEAPMAYLMEPRNGEMSGTEFAVHHQAIPDHLKAHPHFSDIDKHLVSRAALLLESFSVPPENRRKHLNEKLSTYALK